MNEALPVYEIIVKKQILQYVKKMGKLLMINGITDMKYEIAQRIFTKIKMNNNAE